MSQDRTLQIALPKRTLDSLKIRLMCVDDLDRVQQIDQLSFSLPWPESAYRYELLENPCSLLWVAEIEGENSNQLVVGCVVVWLIMDEAHIATVVVDPIYRQNGIASHLMAEMLKEVIQKGARLATLEVREHNLAAQRLYKRFRFEVVGRRPRYYHDNFEDALIMTVMGLDQDYNDWLGSGGWINLSMEDRATRLNA
jgi:[ribosomal protein S18]-alanine N-acetyltransferase